MRRQARPPAPPLPQTSLFRGASGNAGVRVWYSIAAALVVAAVALRLYVAHRCPSSRAAKVPLLQLLTTSTLPCHQAEEKDHARTASSENRTNDFQLKTMCVLLDWPQHRESEFLERKPRPDLTLTLRKVLGSFEKMTSIHAVHVFVGTDVRNASSLEKTVASLALDFGHKSAHVQARVMPLYGLNGKDIATLNFMARRAYRITSCSHFLAISPFSSASHANGTSERKRTQLIGPRDGLAVLDVLNAFDEVQAGDHGCTLNAIALSEDRNGLHAWWGLFTRGHMEALSQVLLPVPSMDMLNHLLIGLYLHMHAAVFIVAAQSSGSVRKLTAPEWHTDDNEESRDIKSRAWLERQIQEIAFQVQIHERECRMVGGFV
ncbi:hypothetical protein FVE85_7345 [Porphyridium purpureum]|uniref:Uncharacterized protein n=1 Tax=Porphyridium purpureum TaxID=35688 RepID=A0A5J4Z9F7_PORPP|nr:hypothetical protein FVE85_7345 [Porphyridium purpureum]|eukprot:POR7258..scf295_1